jgi:proton-translocating NADH-quinone oxidoreductase chain M
MFKKIFMLVLNPDTTLVSLLVVFAALCALLSMKSAALVASAAEGGQGNEGGRGVGKIRNSALFISFVPLIWSLYVWGIYDGSGQTYQCLCECSSLHVSLGVDAAGLGLLMLTTGIIPLCIMLVRTLRGILALLLLELLLVGSLLVLDLLGFYVLFESSLILLFIIIARPERFTSIELRNRNVKGVIKSYGAVDAAYRIVLYTLIGSLLFLPVIFVLLNMCGTTNLLLLTMSNETTLSVESQMVLGWGLFAVLAVKLPLIPVHLWLPEAHVAAPTAGSVLLAGIMLKLGGLGLIRFLIPIFPVFVVKVFPLIALMCLGSFLLSSLSTLRQVDLKKIVAYSSIAHMSLVTLAICSMSEHSVGGATYMMIAHGLVSPGLFLLVGFLYERHHTKIITYYSGLATSMPIYALLFFVLTLANLSFPLSPNFIAEVLCLINIFAVHSMYAFVYCCSQVIGAVYGLWAYARMMHGNATLLVAPEGRLASPFSGALRLQLAMTDLTRRELLLITPIMMTSLWLGLKPMA